MKNSPVRSLVFWGASATFGIVPALLAQACSGAEAVDSSGAELTSKGAPDAGGCTALNLATAPGSPNRAILQDDVNATESTAQVSFVLTNPDSTPAPGCPVTVALETMDMSGLTGQFQNGLGTIVVTTDKTGTASVTLTQTRTLSGMGMGALPTG